MNPVQAWLHRRYRNSPLPSHLESPAAVSWKYAESFTKSFPAAINEGSNPCFPVPAFAFEGYLVHLPCLQKISAIIEGTPCCVPAEHVIGIISVILDCLTGCKPSSKGLSAP